jgi:hypothetical protein
MTEGLNKSFLKSVNLKRIFLLCMVLLLVTGCSNEAGKVKENNTKIHKGNMTVYEEALTAEDIQEDIDGDGQKERIILNISPAPVPHPTIEGQYLWDSSHVWQLLVEDNGEYYTLFDAPVQGRAELYIISENDNQNAIVLQQKGTTLNLSAFRYKNDYL